MLDQVFRKMYCTVGLHLWFEGVQTSRGSEHQLCELVDERAQKTMTLNHRS